MKNQKIHIKHINTKTTPIVNTLAMRNASYIGNTKSSRKARRAY